MYLLISESPVAGTVERIATWLGRITGKKTVALVERNYPHNAFELANGSFGCLGRPKDFLAAAVKQAEVVFLHNVFGRDLINLVFDAKVSSAPVYFQYHSPPSEPPAYNYEVLSEFTFDAVLAVAQGHGRFYQDRISVPNIISDFLPELAPIRQNILFLPQLRTTNFRWSNKLAESDLKALDNIGSIFKEIQIASIQSAFKRPVVSHSEILFYMHSVSMVIDDVNSGLFHQSALEGLKCGCGVFSGADIISVEEFCCAADCDPPPFVSVYDVNEVISYLVEHRRKLVSDSAMAANKEFASKYLGEERLAHCYHRIIKPLL